MSRSRLQSLNSNIDHMKCSLSSKNSPRNTVDFEAACSVYIRFRGVNGYTAWEKIKRWIDHSDCFMLILGGRYGSLEPKSGKSFVHLEYEYALKKRKPFFALVIHRDALEQKAKQKGLHAVDERDNPNLYKDFQKLVRLMSGNWCDCRALAQRDGAPPRRKSLPDGRMRGE